VQNLMPVGPTVAELWRFCSFSRWRPSVILVLKI